MNPPTIGTPPTTTPAAGRYRLDPTRTTVRFHTRHLFGLGAVSGTVKLREADLIAAEPLAASKLHAVLDAASFDTGHPKRDTDVRSAKFLDVAAHPEITFDSREIRRHGGTWRAAGTLTAHGVAAPTELTVNELTDNAGTLTIRATTTIDRYAQGTAGKGLAARWLAVDITATANKECTDD
jgi:polyisoprenoid-binding protein YceI